METIPAEAKQEDIDQAQAILAEILAGRWRITQQLKNSLAAAGPEVSAATIETRAGAMSVQLIADLADQALAEKRRAAGW